MKRNIKTYILGFITGAVIFSSIGVMAYSLNARDIGFTPSNSNWNVDNLEDAVNDLYSKDSGMPMSVEKVYSYVGTSVNYNYEVPEDGFYIVGVNTGNYSPNVNINTTGNEIIHDYRSADKRGSRFKVISAKAHDTINLSAANSYWYLNAYIYKVENYDINKINNLSYVSDGNASLSYTATEDEYVLCVYSSSGKSRSHSISLNNNIDIKVIPFDDSGIYILKMKSGSSFTVNAYGYEWGAGSIYILK